MAVSSKIEEILLEITKNIGNIHKALKLGIGNVNIPGSAIFEINNLRSVASNGYPYFGVVETDPLGFQPSYSSADDVYNVKISPGTISYNSNLLNILEQKIPIKKEFLKDYSVLGDPTVYKYGITVGLPIEEASKSVQNFSTTTKLASSIGSTLIYVESISDALTLGFPISAQVSNYFIKFKGTATIGNTNILLVDDNYYNGAGYGTLPTNVSANSSINFIYTPKLNYITGFPVSTTNEDPNQFNYFPALPSNWIPIAKILVEDPSDPRVSGASNNAMIRTVVDMPTNTSDNLILGDSADVSEVVSNCDTAITNLTNYKLSYGLNSFYSALENYTQSLTSSSNLNFNQFWSQQPFRKTQYFSKGLSFSGLERFEFSKDFKEGYFQAKTKDLQHTFAIFRGDLVKYNAGILSTFVIGESDITGNVITCSSNVSSLKPGTQIYGVSAVKTVDGTNYLETVPSYKSILSTSTTNSNYLTELTWTGTAVTDTLFYNVYKKSESVSEQFEKKLTLVDEVLYPSYNSYSPTTDNSNYELAYKQTAINFTVDEDAYLGGISLKLGHLSTGLTATGTSGLYIGIYGDDSGEPSIIDTKVENVLLRYSDIESGSKEYTVKFPTGINIDGGTSLWLLITKDYDFVVGSASTSLFLRVNSALSGFTKTSTTDFNGLNTWTNTAGLPYLKLRGFLDDGNIVGNSVRRGVKLTNNIANIPRRLSVYVPPVDDIVDDTGLFFNGSSVAIAATTDKTIKNDLVVSVTAQKGENGTPSTFTTTIPKGTDRNTRFLLGTVDDLFDRVTDVSVVPGANLTRSQNGPILWDIYDLITVETEP